MCQHALEHDDLSQSSRTHSSRRCWLRIGLIRPIVQYSLFEILEIFPLQCLYTHLFTVTDLECGEALPESLWRSTSGLWIHHETLRLFMVCSTSVFTISYGTTVFRSTERVSRLSDRLVQRQPNAIPDGQRSEHRDTLVERFHLVEVRIPFGPDVLLGFPHESARNEVQIGSRLWLCHAVQSKFIHQWTSSSGASLRRSIVHPLSSIDIIHHRYLFDRSLAFSLSGTSDSLLGDLLLRSRLRLCRRLCRLLSWLEYRLQFRRIRSDGAQSFPRPRHA